MESTIFQPHRRMLYMNGELGSFEGITDSGSDFLYHQVHVTPFDTFKSTINGQEYPSPVEDYTGNGVTDDFPLSPWGRYFGGEFPNSRCQAAVWDKEDGVWYVVHNNESTTYLFRCGEFLETNVEVIASNFIDTTTHIIKDILLCNVLANPTGYRKVLVFRIAPRVMSGAVSGEPYNTTLAWMPNTGGALTTFQTILYPRSIATSDVQRQVLWSMDSNRTPGATLSFYGLIDCFFYTSNAQTHYQQRIVAWQWNKVAQTFNTATTTGISGHFIGPKQVQTISISFPLTFYTRIGYLPGLNDFSGGIAFVRQRFVDASTINSTETGYRRTQHEVIFPSGGSATTADIFIRLPLGPHVIVDEEFNQISPDIYGAQVWQDDETRSEYVSMEGSAGSFDTGFLPREGVGIYSYPPVAQRDVEAIATANRVQVTGRQASAASNSPGLYPLKLSLGPGCY